MTRKPSLNELPLKDLQFVRHKKTTILRRKPTRDFPRYFVGHTKLRG